MSDSETSWYPIGTAAKLITGWEARIGAGMSSRANRSTWAAVSRSMLVTVTHRPSASRHVSSTNARPSAVPVRRVAGSGPTEVCWAWAPGYRCAGCCGPTLASSMPRSP